jgi:hypothetical protein
VSFASEPGRDDGNLPPVNVVIPDDARELDRDVLAYRREMRATRRRRRLARLLRPFRAPEFGRRAAIVPLVAICLAITLVGGALLSVATMSPASAPTLSGPAQSGAPRLLPSGSVQLGRTQVPVRSLVTSAIALVPPNCDCGAQLQRLATQAVAADVKLYFAGSGAEIPQLGALATRDGDGAAVAAADYDAVLTSAYQPSGLTVLLVYRDATADVKRGLTANFDLTAPLRQLSRDGAGSLAGQGSARQPTAA